MEPTVTGIEMEVLRLDSPQYRKKELGHLRSLEMMDLNICQDIKDDQDQSRST